MRLEDLLVAKGLVQPADLQRAGERRLKHGGPLADSLLALRLITLEQLNALLQMTPPAMPSTVAGTGITERTMLYLVLKGLYSSGADTVPKLSDLLKLPPTVLEKLLQEANALKLVRVVGSEGQGTIPVLTYALTEAGRDAAAEATKQSKYLGPAPVGLAAFVDQLSRQRLGREKTNREGIKEAFSDLVVSEHFANRLGPAINSGRSILLYGAPGNGKSSIAERIGRLFTDIIYVPYCIEVEGQIIKILDTTVHIEVKRQSSGSGIEIRGGDFDRRWVPCRRPVIITGGELTLEMLDLRYNEVGNFYDSPLHVKALGGIFVIDDFGRQFVKPEALLNRWIIPLEERIEYLTLQTGATFSLPFDELIVFSTNLTPDDLMDPAFLRRIPYKIECVAPSREQYREIFDRVAASKNLELGDDLFDWTVEELHERRRFPLACYQPAFIASQVIEACEFDGRRPEITESLIVDALDNLYTSTAKERLTPKGIA
jgi:hypothetical protein